MNEEQFREKLNAYIDGELDDQTALQIKRFIAENPLAALEYEREQKFHNLLKNHLRREEAPYELREAVVQRFERPSWPWNWGWAQPLWRPVVTFFVIIAFIFAVFIRPSESFPIFQESITRHMDCLKGIYNMEILSDDPQEIASWFQGKLGFAVNPPDLSAHGVKLKGARLCHLRDKKVAFLTYDYNGRQISAFILDVERLQFPKSDKMDTGEHILYVKADKGYQSVVCLNKKMKDIACVFVSDLPQKDLINLIM